MSFKYLSFTGQRNCYAALPLSLLPGATTFTIEAKIATTSTKNGGSNYTWSTIAGREIGNYWQNDFGFCVNDGKLCFWAEPKSNGSNETKNTTTTAVVNDGKIHEVAVVSANGAIDLFCDGVNVAHTNNVNAKITDDNQIYLAYNGDGSGTNAYLQMDLYEIRFWSVARAAEDIGADIDGTEAGLAGWYLPTDGALNDYSGNERHATLYGSPAFNEVDYLSFTTTFDVQRKVHNPPLEWRYENAGDADDLILTAPILTNLPATQSKTGTAFYQTTRAKCFDLPATSEVWMKFDVYCNGSQRWRAYNGGNNGVTGLTVQTSGKLDYFCNDNEVYNVSGVAARLRVQTVLLHMVSGSSDGIIEAWADGDFIYRYTGDVNHGQDFADIYLQSDGSGTFFSNVIISNAPIGLDEDAQTGEVVTVDIERALTNDVTVIADLQRRLSVPVEVIADLERNVTHVTMVEVLADLERNVLNSVTVLADLERNVDNIITEEIFADVQRRVTTREEFTTDLERLLIRAEEFTADVERRISARTEVLADLERNVIVSCEVLADVERRVQNVTVGERMLSRVSPVYDNSTFMKSFLNALGNEWAPLRHYFTTLREQRFISTVDWGIEYLEHKYSVTPDRTLTLDERRARLGIKAFKKYPLNPAVLEKYARDFCGLEVYLDESDAGFIWIIAAELTAQGYKDFMTFLRREKPAHLALAMLLHMSRYVGTPDTNEPTDDLNLPKVYAGVVSTIRGKISTIARLPDSPPQNQRLNLYAGNVMTVRGKISTSTRALN